MELFIFPFKSMGCPCELRIYAGQKHQAQLAAKACMDEAARFEQKYSRYLDSSAATESVTTVILNSPPNEPSVSISPNTPGEEEDLICQIDIESLDIDGDSLTYSTTW